MSELASDRHNLTGLGLCSLYKESLVRTAFCALEYGESGFVGNFGIALVAEFLFDQTQVRRFATCS